MRARLRLALATHACLLHLVPRLARPLLLPHSRRALLLSPHLNPERSARQAQAQQRAQRVQRGGLGRAVHVSAHRAPRGACLCCTREARAGWLRRISRRSCRFLDSWAATVGQQAAAPRRYQDNLGMVSAPAEPSPRHVIRPCSLRAGPGAMPLRCPPPFRLSCSFALSCPVCVPCVPFLGLFETRSTSDRTGLCCTRHRTAMRHSEHANSDRDREREAHRGVGRGSCTANGMGQRSLQACTHTPFPPVRCIAHALLSLFS